jgi:hypothetical protein
MNKIHWQAQKLTTAAVIGRAVFLNNIDAAE